jgi:hypothetical protein
MLLKKHLLNRQSGNFLIIVVAHIEGIPRYVYLKQFIRVNVPLRAYWKIFVSNLEIARRNDVLCYFKNRMFQLLNQIPVLQEKIN